MFSTVLTRSSNEHVRRVLIVVLATLMLFATLTLIPGAPLGADPAHAATIAPTSGFEIDGNLAKDGAGPLVGDWLEVYGAGLTPASDPTTGIYYHKENTDVCASRTDDVAAKSPAVKLADGPIWRVAPGAAKPDKGDLKAVWVGAEKIDVSGQINDMLYLAFELCNAPNSEFQVALALEGPDGVPPFNPADNPTGSTDDLLIVFNFTPSTGTATALIHTFDGTQWNSATEHIPGPSWEASILPGGSVGEIAINLTTAGLLSGDECSSITVSDQVATINGNSLTSGVNDIVAVDPLEIDTCGTLKVEKLSDPDVPGAGSFAYGVVQSDVGVVSGSNLDVSGVTGLIQPNPPVDGSTLLNASINVGETDTWANVISASDYTIFETILPVGWKLDTISCEYTDIFQSPVAPKTVVIYENGAETGNEFLIPPDTFPPGTISPTKCTITNTTSGVIVEKVGAGDTSTVFPFAINGEKLKISGVEVDGLKLTETSDATPFTPGTTVTVTETLPTASPAWTHTSTTCLFDDGSTVPTTGLNPTFDTVAGKVITCTFENNQAAKIIVEKQTLPDGSPQAFAFAGTELNSTGIYDGDTIEASVDPGGPYTSTEVVPNGWDLTDISCDDPGSSGDLDTKTATFNVVAGQTVKCTFTNTEAPILKLVKTVTTADGGDAVADDWTLTAVSQGADDTRDISTLGGSGTADDVFADTVYDLAETSLPGYTPGAWSCVGGTQSGSTIELAPGESSVCTINNDDIAPTLQLVKVVDNTNGGDAVADDWTLTAVSQGSDASRDISTPGGSGTVDNVFANTVYHLAETSLPGYLPDEDWTCVITPPDGDPYDLIDVNHISLSEGETGVCTIVNDDIAPTLKLVKTVDTDDGGNEDPSDWTLTAKAAAPDDGRNYTKPGDHAAFETVFSNTDYVLAESTVPGYTPGTWSCDKGVTVTGDTINLTEGQTGVTCTINNDDIAPTLKLVKTVDTDDGGTAGPGDWTLTAIASAPDDTSRNYSEAGDHGTFETMFSNTDYVLAESVVPGYTPGTWSCDGGTLAGSTVTLAEGETNVTCTINNDDIAPTLKLVKTVDNGDGGDAVADDWTLTAVSQGADDTRDISTLGGSGTADDVFADTVYDLAESVVPGYAANNWNCVGGTQSGSTIELAPGESSVCTIDNVDIAPTLKLVKTVDTDDGGTAGPGDWTLTAIASAPDDTSRNYSEAGDHGTFETMFSNTDYVLAESVVPGYTPGTWSCDSDVTVTGDTITLDEGQTDVTCTINNDDVAPTLKLVKTVDNGDGGNAVADDWTLTAESQGADDTRDISTLGGSGTADDVFAAVEYALAETTVPGYTNGTTWSCTAGTMNAANNGVTLTVGQDAVCTIVNDDIAPTLNLFKAVLSDHGGSAVPPDWNLLATSTSTDGDFVLPASFYITDTVGSTTPQYVFANNEYTLSETGTDDHTGDYTQDGPWSCVITDVAGVDGDVVHGDTITLTEGESADCIVVNDDDAAELTLVKKVVNDNGGTSVAADWTLKATSTSTFGDISALADQNTEDGGLTGDTGPQEVHANNLYTLSEMGTADYTQVGMWSCVIDGADPVLSNTITLAHGAVATCTATNDDDPAHLILVKDVVNDNGGDAVASAWDLIIDEGAAGEKSVPGSVAGLEVTDQAGTYDLSESTLPGYTNTLITCDNLPDGVPPGAPVTTVTIGIGETVTCTFTNDDVAPTLILAKSVSNGDGGDSVAADWTLTATSSGDGDFSLLADKNTSPAGSEGDTGTQDVYANNTYTLSETGPDGYAQDGQWECTITDATGAEGAPVDGDTITLGEGESAICWVDNDDIAPTLILAKSVSNDNGGDSVAADWTLTATSSGDGDFSLLANKNTTPGGLEGDTGIQDVYANNTYTLSETGPDGYTQVGLWECVVMDATGAIGDPIPGNTITLGEGEAAECGAINDDDPASLLLQKTVVNDNGGNGIAADWTLSAGSNDVTGSATPVEATNQAGTYALSESVEPGYAQTSLTCSDDPGVEVTSVTIGLGETITCEFVNDDLTVGIDIEKSTNGHDADDPTGPYVAVGGVVTWEYVVTNPGLIALSKVIVTDSVTGVSPAYVSGDTNGDDLLDDHETWIYEATGVAVAGQYANIGKVTAVVGSGITPLGIVDAGVGDTVTATDPSHYFGSDPAIGLVKTGAFGIGDDKIAKPGDLITYTFEVSNDGNVALTDVDVTDLTLGGINVSCPETELAVGESMTCSADYPVTQADLDAGTVHNCALAAGLDPIDDEVTDEDCTDTDLPLAQFGDTVWQDKNKNGKQDAGEPGINGAKVFLMDDTGTIIATATTVKGPWDGWYKFTELMPGKYTVTLDMKSVTGALTTAGSFTVTLAGGDNYIDADFGIAEVLPITGMNAAALALVALAMLAAGAVAVLFTRKRREDS